VSRWRPEPPPLPSESVSEQELERSADIGMAVRTRVAGALGITALALTMLTPCSCGGTLLVGGLLGAGAALAGARARNSEPDPAGRAWATSALWTGGLAAGIALLVALVLALALVLQVMGTIEAVQAMQSMI